MGLIKITFDSASVTSKQDADVNHFLAGNQNGIIKSLGGNCAASTSNNYINFQAGYVQAYGRRVYVEAGTRISISLDGNAYGYVFVKVDLGNNAATLEKRESTSSWPTLTQEDLRNGGLIFELPLVRYTKTASSLTLDTTWSPTLITNDKDYIDSKITTLKSDTASAFGTGFASSPTVSGKYRYFSGLTLSKLQKAVIGIKIGDDIVFCPGSSIAGGSVTSLNYSYYGTRYSLYVEWLTSAKLCITVGENDHTIKCLYFFYHGGY